MPLLRSPLAARVSELEARNEIQDLLVRYAAGIRDGDAEQVASCFSDDARLELAVGLAVEGRDAIRAHTAESVSGGVFAQAPLRLDPHIVSTPVVGNVAIKLDGDSARSTCIGIAVHGGVRSEDGDARELVLLRGSVYADELIQTPAGWKIRVRKQTTLWQIEVPVALPLRRP